MGQRANLILVRNGSYELYYSHWCANTLPRDLFWGPEETLSFIEGQQPAEGWLDDRWAEGGVIMDMDHQVLLWYGGEDIMYDIPLRRQLFALMQPLWSGWELRWAKAGIVDMAMYLHYPLEHVRSLEYTTELISLIEPEPKDGFIRIIASIVFPNGELRIFPLSGTFDEYLLAGPSSFIQAISPASGQPELRVAEWSEDFPDQGFHLDTRRRSLDIWYAGDDSDIITHVKKCWPDWTVTDLADQYEVQSVLTGNAVIFSPQSQSKLISQLQEMLLYSASSSPVDSIKLFADYHEKAGREVEVNPLALIDHPQGVAFNTREDKFKFALSQAMLNQDCDEALNYNATGSFHDTVRIFAKYAEKDWLSSSSQQSWLMHMQAFFLYMEALLYIGQVQDVEKTQLDLYKKMHTEGTKRFGCIYSSSVLLQLVEGSLLLFQPHGNTEQVMRTLGPLREREQLKPEHKFKITYYMALANIQDGNFVDAKAKLAEGMETKEPFWIRKLQELNDSIEEYENPQSVLLEGKKGKRPLFVELARGEQWVGATSLSPDGSLTAVMYMDGWLKLSRTADGDEIAAFSDSVSLFQEEKATNMSLVFSPDGHFLLVGLGVGIVKVYDVQKLKLHAEHLHPGLDWEQLERNAYYHEYTYVQFSASGKYMVIVPTAKDYDPQGDDGYPIPLYYGTFYVIDFSTGEVVLEHSYKERKIGAIMFSPDERLIAVGMFGKEVVVWDIQCRKTILERDDFVWLGLADCVGMTQTLAFTVHSDKLVYASKNAKLTVVDLLGEGWSHSVAFEHNYVTCALYVDSKDYIIAAKYAHYKPVIITRWKIGDPKEEVLFIVSPYVVKEFSVDEAHDELWVSSTSTAELRKYSTGELVRKWTPYSWWYSYGVIYNSISVSSQAGMVAISHQEGIRIGRSRNF
ncbi:WD40 repeat domain-containing protein [Paenibacillus sp. OSY-SE]|uniref:WD40 repeat domain-containing protein n=1 Tax=Paenibacillus sp. OSY-SE TaxID=1196323 RepID=UPI0002D9055F|nr:hypothetical protein [Paenibacillus sp. OSY-SE]